MIGPMELLIAILLLAALGAASARWGTDSRDYLAAKSAWPFRRRHRATASGATPTVRQPDAARRAKANGAVNAAPAMKSAMKTATLRNAP